jgi:Zn-dependent M16 (insulinase) family peptidase
MFFKKTLMYIFHVMQRNNIGKVTGGVSASLEIMTVKPNGWDDDAKVLPGVNMLTMLMIHGKCTSDKAGELFSIFNTILTDINIEDSKGILLNSLKSSLSSKKSSVASSGHSYANRRIRGRYSGMCQSHTPRTVLISTYPIFVA